MINSNQSSQKPLPSHSPTEKHLLTDSPSKRNRLTQSEPTLSIHTIKKSSPIPISGNQSKMAENRLFRNFSHIEVGTPKKNNKIIDSSLERRKPINSLPVNLNIGSIPRKDISDVIFEDSYITAKTKKSSSDSKEDSIPIDDYYSSPEDSNSDEYVSQYSQDSDSDNINEDQKDR